MSLKRTARSPFRHFLTFAAAALLPACAADIPGSNTLDPDAPVTVQDKSTLKGRVLLEDRGAARSARVSLSGPSSELSETSSEGEFEITGLTPGTYLLSVTQEGYERIEVTDITLAIGETVSLGVLTLPLLRAAVSGQVQVDGVDNHSGVAVTLTSVPPATVSQALRPTQEDPPGDPVIRRFGTITDADGDWTFEGVPIGTYRVIATLPDHTQFCRDLVEITADADELRVDSVMRLIPASAVIRLVDGNGTPVVATSSRTVDAELLAFGAVDVRYATDLATLAATEYTPFTASLVQDLEIAGADTEDGVVTLYAQFRDTCELESAVYEASAIYDTTPPALRLVDIEDGAPFLVDPQGLATLEVDASDAVSGLHAMHLSINGEAQDGPEGRPYALRSVLSLGAEEGPKAVEVSVEDLAGNRTEAVALSIIKDTEAPVPGLTPVAIDEAVDGRVNDTDITLRLDFAGEPSAMSIRNQPGTEAGPWVPYADIAGWRLAAGADGPRSIYLRVRDAAGNTTDELSIDVLLDTRGVVSGSVTLEELGAIAGVDVNLGAASTTTGEGGAFEITDVAPGFHTLSIQREGYTTLSIGFPILPGQTVDLGALSLFIARGDLRGEARLADATQHSGIRVEIEGTDLATVTVASGAWRIEDVPVGQRTVVARANGYLPARWEAQTIVADTLVDIGERVLAVRPATLVIEDGARVVNRRNVSLALGWTGAVEVQLSEDPSFADPTRGDVEWQAFDPAGDHRFELSAGENQKQLFARFRDGEGEVSPRVSASVRLDQTPPTGTLHLFGVLADGSESRAITTDLSRVRAEIEATGEALEMWLTTGADMPDCAAADWGPVNGAQDPFLLTASDGMARGWLCLRDEAGNVTAPPAGAELVFDDTAPGGCSLELTGVTASGGSHASRTASADVPYRLACADTPALSVIVVGEVAPDCGTVDYAGFAPTGELTLDAAEGALARAHACVRDAAGNTAGPITSNALTLDTTAPLGLALALNGGSAWWNAADVAGAAFEVPATFSASEDGRYELATDPGFLRVIDGDYVAAAGDASADVGISPVQGLSQNIYLRVIDAVGNISAVVSQAITVDTAAPLGRASLVGQLADGSESNTWTTDLSSARLEIDAGDAIEMRTGSGQAPLSCAADSGWDAVQTEISPFALEATVGIATAWVCLRDEAGNPSVAPLLAVLAFDDQAPQSCAITLTGRTQTGAPHPSRTAALTVDYAVNCTDAPTQMALALGDDPLDCSAAEWVDLAAFGSVDIPDGDGGDKRLRGCFRDLARNATVVIESNALTLDTAAPVGLDLTLHDGSGWWNGAAQSIFGFNLPVSFSASESGSFQLARDAEFTQPVVGLYDHLSGNGAGTIGILGNEGVAQDIFLRVIDEVGNVSDAVSGQITVDISPPTGAIVLAGQLADGSESEAVLTDLDTARLRIASDGAVEMRAGTGRAPATCAASSGWIEVAGEIAPFPIEASEGSASAWLCLRDAAGNRLPEPLTDVIDFDDAAPTNCTVQLSGRTLTGESHPSRTASTAVDYALGCDEAPAEMALATGADALDCANASWVPFDAEGVVTLPENPGVGETLRACFRDGALNATAVLTSNALVLDDEAPEGLTLALHNGSGFWNTASQAQLGFSVPVRVTASESGRFELATEPLFLDPVSGDYDALAGPGAASIEIASDEGVAQSIYLRVADTLGNVSAAIEAQITVDLTRPTGSVDLVGNLADGNDSDTWIQDLAAARLAITHAGAADMRVGTGAAPADCESAAGWMPVADAVDPFAVADVDGTATAWLCLRDVAGNVSAAPSIDTLRFDNRAPQNCRVTLVGRNVDGSPNATHTASRTVDYTLACDDAPAQMAVAIGADPLDCSAAAYSNFGPTGTVELPAGDGGGKTLRACFRDLTLNATAVIDSNGLTLDTTAPAGLTLAVHDGDGWWNAADHAAMGFAVPVRFNAGESGRFQLSAESQFVAALEGDFVAGPEGFGALVSIAATEGVTQRIHFRVIDRVGNISAAVSQPITVDREAPSGELTVLGTLADGLVSDTWITDLAGGLLRISHRGATQMRAGTGAVPEDCAGNDWVDIQPELSPFAVAQADGVAGAWLCLRDAADNRSPTPLVDTLLFDATAPQNCAITLSGRTVGGSASQTVTATRTVDFTATCDDAPAEMLLVAGDPAPDCGAAEYGNYVASGAIELSAGDGAGKIIRGCFRDRARNATAVIPSTALTLDTRAPGNLSVTLHDGRGWWASAEVAAMGFDVPLQVSASEAGHYELALAPSFATIVAEGDFDPADGPAAAQLTMPNTEGQTHQVFMRIADTAGNLSSPIEARITVDTLAPNGSIQITGLLADGTTPSVERTATLSGATLDISANADAFEMKVATGAAAPDCSDDSGYGSVVPRREAFDLAVDGDGNGRVWLCLRDAAGNYTDPAIADVIDYDNSAPTNCGITLTGRTVSGGAHATLSAEPTVDFVLGCDEVPARMALTTAASLDCNGATYVDFDAEGSIKLPPGDGVARAVRGCFRDIFGNTTAAVVSNNIQLDTTAPSGLTLEVNGGSAWWNAANQAAMGYAVPLRISASESGTWYTSTSLAFDTGRAAPYDAADGVIDATVDIADTAGVLQDVYFRVVDGVGNVSGVISKRITVDLTPPTGTVTILDGETWLNADTDGNLSLRITAADTHGSVASMQVFKGPGACSGGVVSFATSGTVNLFPNPATGDEGPYAASVCLIDAAGNVSAPFRDFITYDRTVPTIDAGTFSISATDGHVATTSVVLDMSITEGIPAKLVAVSLSNTLHDCATAAYQAVALPASGDLAIPWVLSDGDGSKSVYACLMDEAGNRSAVPTQTASSVVLDTQAPDPGSLLLAGGVSYLALTDTTNNGVGDTPLAGLAVVGLGANLKIKLSGDIELGGGDGVYGFDSPALPGTITLSALDGLKTVTGFFIDRAGNASIPFSDSVTVDSVKPDVGSVALAGGQPVVNEQLIAVTIEDTVGSTMRFWEDSGAGCGTCTCTYDNAVHDPDVACGNTPPTSFSPNTSFTLSGGDPGNRTVCWQFCDEAGNASDVGSESLFLDTFIDRPQPTVAELHPISYLALEQADYFLVIEGTGVSHNTKAQVGDFQSDCQPVQQTGVDAEGLPVWGAFADADKCKSGANAGVDPTDVDPGTCAPACRIRLDDNIMLNSGSYTVRLFTPDPVSGGDGTSDEEEIFNVIAPTPVIASISPRGLVQKMDASNVPIPEDIKPITVCGSKFMNNVAIQIETNAGQVLTLTPEDNGLVDRCVTANLNTAGLLPSDLVAAKVFAVNPPPGGGSASADFGLNPENASCTSYPCNARLPGTRARTDKGDTLFQGYALGGFSGSIMTFENATGAAALDSNGNVLVRVEAQNRRGTLPLPNAYSSIRVEDSTGLQGITKLDSTRRIAVGTFTREPQLVTPGELHESDLETGDFNNDGLADFVGANQNSSTVNVYPSPYTVGGGPTRYDLDTLTDSVSVAVGDLSGDGRDDIVVTRSGNLTSVFIANGDFSFLQRADYTGGGVSHAEIADVNEDGHPDIISCAGPSLFVREGGKDGIMRSTQSTVSLGGSCASFDLADVNFDGHLDLAVATTSQGEVYFGDGAGAFGARQIIDLGVGAGDIEVGDVNGDTMLDLVFSRSHQIIVRVWDGTGVAGFGTANHSVTDDPDGDVLVHIRMHDMTGDGILDLVWAWRRGNSYILPGDGAGNFPYANRIVPNTGPGPALWGSHHALGDINGDGAMDAGFLELWDSINLLQGAAQVVDTGRRYTVTTGTQAVAAEALDVDSDGDLDLAVGVSTNAERRLYTNDGLGGFSTFVSLGTGGGSIVDMARADFNLDGNADLVAFHSGVGTNGNADIYFGDGAGNLTQSQILNSTETRGHKVLTPDVNNDGYPDLAFAGRGGGARGWKVFLNQQDGTFVNGTASIYAIANDENGAIGDFNNDGLVDLAFGSASPVVSLQQSDGTFVDLAAQSIANRTGQLEFADFNGDGILDAMPFGYQLSPRVRILRGDGQGLFPTTHYFSLLPAITFYATPSDLNGDGAMDFMLYSIGATSIKRLFGRRDSDAFNEAPEIDTDTGGTELVLADLNGDGLMDTVHPTDLGVLLDIHAPPEQWTMHLSEMPAPTVNIPAGGSVSVTAHQGLQLVDSVGLKLHVDAPDTTSLDSIRVSLTSPSGVTEIIDEPALAGCNTSWTNTNELLAVYPSPSKVCDNANLANLAGWHNEGNWTLTLTNGSGSDLTLVNFDIVLQARLAASQAPGKTAATARQITLVPGRRGTIIQESAYDGPIGDQIGCGDGANTPSRWFEFELDSAQFVTARTRGNFNTVMAMREGACVGAINGRCDTDSGASTGALLPGHYMPAGKNCLVVEGEDAGAGGGHGDFEVQLWRGDDACDVAPEIASAINAGIIKSQTQHGRNNHASSCGSTNSNELVFKLTAPSANPITIAATNSNYNNVISVRTTCGDVASQVVCNNDFTDDDAQVTFTPTAGQTYYVIVEGVGTATGNADLVITQ